MLQVIDKDDKRTISLQGDLTIYQITEVAEQLMPQLSPDFDLELNLADISEMDSAGAQLLMFAQQHVKQQANKLTLTDHSQAVLEVFEQLNLVSWFEDPIVITSGGDE